MKIEHIVRHHKYDIFYDSKELLLVIHEKDGTDTSYHGDALAIVAELDRRGLWRNEI